MMYASQSAKKSRDSDNGIISLSSMDEEETKVVGGMRTTMTTSQQSESLKSNSDVVEMPSDAEANVDSPLITRHSTTLMRHDGDVSRLVGHGQSGSGKLRQRLKKSGIRCMCTSRSDLFLKIWQLFFPPLESSSESPSDKVSFIIGAIIITVVVLRLYLLHIMHIPAVHGRQSVIFDICSRNCDMR